RTPFSEMSTRWSWLVDWALPGAVLCGQKCSRPDRPAAQSHKVRTAPHFPDAKHSSVATLNHNFWKRVSGRMQSSRDRSVMARPALDQRGYLGATVYQIDLVRQFA